MPTAAASYGQRLVRQCEPSPLSRSHFLIFDAENAFGPQVGHVISEGNNDEAGPQSVLGSTSH